MPRWTVDLETDWGGRSVNTLGMKFGLPAILELFKTYGIKATFFVSTELIDTFRDELIRIKNMGHTLGSHGHFHIVWKDWWRAEDDRRISQKRLSEITGHDRNPYRAPKFSHETADEYSTRKGHVGLLKHMWFGGKVRDDSIIYLHPFDIVDCMDDAPSLFCRLWYSRPRGAYHTLCRLLDKTREGNSYVR